MNLQSKVLAFLFLVIVSVLGYAEHEHQKHKLFDQAESAGKIAGRQEVQAKWDAEKLATARAEKEAVFSRIKNNERVAEQQALDQQKIRTANEKEIADVRAVPVAAGRMRVSQGFCAGFASTTQTSGSSRGDATTTAASALPDPYARDIDALMLEADLVVAGCRAAQGFIRVNGLAP